MIRVSEKWVNRFGYPLLTRSCRGLSTVNIACCDIECRRTVEVDVPRVWKILECRARCIGHVGALLEGEGADRWKEGQQAAVKAFS